MGGGNNESPVDNRHPLSPSVQPPHKSEDSLKKWPWKEMGAQYRTFFSIHLVGINLPVFQARAFDMMMPLLSRDTHTQWTPGAWVGTRRGPNKSWYITNVHMYNRRTVINIHILCLALCIHAA
jgi:hypothetical protein